jgi:hypothetical protein
MGGLKKNTTFGDKGRVEVRNSKWQVASGKWQLASQKIN